MEEWEREGKVDCYEERIKMYYVHGPISHNECNHYVLLICTNKKLILKGQGIENVSK